MEDTDEDNDNGVLQIVRHLEEEADDNDNNNKRHEDSAIENDGNEAIMTPDADGLIIAFVSLLILALIPIFHGAMRSVDMYKIYTRVFARMQAGSSIHLVVSPENAQSFPFYAAQKLCLLYVLLKFFQPKYIDALLTICVFPVLAVFGLISVVSPILLHVLEFRELTNISTYKKFTFETYHTWGFLIGIVLAGWYVRKKHWIANNLFAISLAIWFVELVHLNSVKTGLVLFAGRYVLELFFVVGTDVMATITALVDIPLKLIFPHNLKEKGVWDADNFVILGMADILLPGTFIALLLRVDNYLGNNWQTYFSISLLAYIVDLYIAISEWRVLYRITRPEFLKVLPVCVLAPLLLAVIKGDVRAMFQYVDYPGMYTLT